MLACRIPLTLAVISGLAAAQTEDPARGVYQRIKVHGKSLAALQELAAVISE